MFDNQSTHLVIDFVLLGHGVQYASFPATLNTFDNIVNKG